MNRAITPKRVLLIIVALLVISSLLPERFAYAITRGPQQVLLVFLGPVTSRLNSFSTAIRRPAELTVELGDKERLETEYLKLQNLNIKLFHDLDAANKIIGQMSAMRQVLRPVVGTPYPADVLVAAGTGLQSALTINAGEQAGVREGMIVTSGYNLVGRVVKVGPTSAVVRLVTMPSKAHIGIGVLISPPTPTNPPRELLGLAEPNSAGTELCVVAGLDKQVEVGDLARLYEDATWPTEARGFIIGEVVRLEKLPTNPLGQRRIIIKPLRDLPYLNRVEVIIPGRSPSP